MASIAILVRSEDRINILQLYSAVCHIEGGTSTLFAHSSSGTSVISQLGYSPERATPKFGTHISCGVHYLQPPHPHLCHSSKEAYLHRPNQKKNPGSHELREPRRPIPGVHFMCTWLTDSDSALFLTPKLQGGD